MKALPTALTGIEAAPASAAAASMTQPSRQARVLMLQRPLQKQAQQLQRRRVI
jgi:hypothetical protein